MAARAGRTELLEWFCSLAGIRENSSALPHSFRTSEPWEVSRLRRAGLIFEPCHGLISTVESAEASRLYPRGPDHLNCCGSVTCAAQRVVPDSCRAAQAS